MELLAKVISYCTCIQGRLWKFNNRDDARVLMRVNSPGTKRKEESKGTSTDCSRPSKAPRITYLPELIERVDRVEAVLAPSAAPASDPVHFPAPAPVESQRLPTMAENKERAEALKVEGNAFLSAKDYARAEECYSQAIALDPMVEAFYTNRCLVRTNLRKFDAAISDCHAALKLNPRSARAYGRLGSAHFQAGNFALSAEAYQSALQLETGNATYQQGLDAAQAELRGPTATGAGAGDTVSQLQSILNAAAAGPTSAKATSVHDCAADMTVGMARSARAMALFNEIKGDYETTLSKATSEQEREAALEQLHARSAPKVLALARNNGGIYNKAAQFVASLQGGAGDKVSSLPLSARALFVYKSTNTDK